MKGVIVSSQEFPERLLANVHVYYNVQHSNHASVKPLSNQDHTASLAFISWTSLFLIYTRLRCFQLHLFEAVIQDRLLLQMLFQEGSITVSASAGHCLLQSPSGECRGKTTKRKERYESRTEGVWAVLPFCVSYPLFLFCLGFTDVESLCTTSARGSLLGNR